MKQKTKGGTALSRTHVQCQADVDMTAALSHTQYQTDEQHGRCDEGRQFTQATLSNASSSTMLFPRTTTMPMDFFSPDLVSSMLSSTTRFMKGSNPRRMPVTDRFPLSFNVIFFSMYFFNSGGWALLILLQ
eukprot:TRINITY_DN69181_c0_g2_i1.p1 TRINITY_DN69181_c0_g2~~TRINITY_DN69181_c0_g2_i1.p1  ORF type:complete len:131 (+),score=24.20 TRINITY_DN69181_c0_g2_i1:165-557(+)